MHWHWKRHRLLALDIYFYNVCLLYIDIYYSWSLNFKWDTVKTEGMSFEIGWCQVRCVSSTCVKLIPLSWKGNSISYKLKWKEKNRRKQYVTIVKALTPLPKNTILIIYKICLELFKYIIYTISLENVENLVLTLDDKDCPLISTPKSKFEESWRTAWWPLLSWSPT